MESSIIGMERNGGNGSVMNIDANSGSDVFVESSSVRNCKLGEGVFGGGVMFMSLSASAQLRCQNWSVEMCGASQLEGRG